MNTLYDDFTGFSVDQSKWSPAILGSNSAANCNSGATAPLLAGGLNGLFRMTTNTTISRGCRLSTQPTLSDGFYQRGNNPIFETKLRTNVVAATRIFAGFTATAVTNTSDTNVSTHHAYIAKRAADTTWQCVTDDGGATETTTNTGVTIAANTFYRLRVELRNGTTPETICTVDDGTTVTRTVVTATQPGATTPMDVYIQAVTSDTTSKSIDIDYVRAWQDDPVPGLTIDNNSSIAAIGDITDAAVLEATSSATLPIEEKVASDSANLNDLVASSINNFFKNLVEFFGKVIFHSDVTFLGRPTFNKDTAGFAVVKSGDSEVGVKFEKVYTSDPVVNISLNIDGEIDMNNLPSYAVADVNTKGFKIRMVKSASQDLRFSWIAIAVPEANKFESSGSKTVVTPTPTITVSPTVTPSETLTPTPTEATQSASPSAQIAP